MSALDTRLTITARYAGYYWKALATLNGKNFETEQRTHNSAKAACTEVAEAISTDTYRPYTLTRLNPKQYEITLTHAPPPDAPKVQTTLHRKSKAYLVEMTDEELALLDALRQFTQEGTRRAVFTHGLVALAEVYAKQISDKKKDKALTSLINHAVNSRNWSNTRTRWRTGSLGL